MITIFKTNSMKNAAEYVIQQLAQVDKTNLSVMRTVIVPDRASLEAERALLKAVGGSFNVQVRTFRRLAGEILPKYDYLSKQAGIMALTGIVQDKKNQLVCYTKGVETAGFVSDMYDTISMMKYCKITPETLQKADLPKSLQGKIHDIALLYSAYLDFTRDKFIDSADKLDLLCQNMSQATTVANGYFYLYDFDNFSAQELALVEQLAKCSLGVTVACCCSENRNDRYLYLNDIFDSVVAMCKNRGLDYRVVPEGNPHKKYGNKFTQQIGEHLFRYDDATPIDVQNFVETYVGTTCVQEVYALACRVQKYVRSGGRFRDVYVVTSDVNKYANAIATVFPEFDIQYFCDSQYSLINHPYARFVLDYLNLCRNNGKLNYVLPFVKNYLYSGNLDSSPSVRTDEDVFMFENYCLKYNISYNYKKKFKLCQEGKKDRDELERADRFRVGFNKLYEAVSFPATATAREYVQEVRRFIQYCNLNARNEAYAKKQIASGMQYDGKITNQVQQKFEEVLQQADMILGERALKLEEFIKLLTVTVTSCTMSVIPVANDCVVFANMAKARKHDIKFLALLGANYGAMPIVKSDGKLLSDKNMDALNELFAKEQPSGAGLQPQIEPKILSENRRERFSLFQLLLEPEEKLYISSVEKDGAATLPVSQFVTELQQLFVTADGKTLAPTREADEDVYTEKQAISKLVLNTRRLSDNQVVKMPSYNVLMEQFADKVKGYQFEKDGKESLSCGEQLFLGRSRTSVSQLTEFYKCPYRFFLEYGLHVKPREVAELKAVDFGNILHDTLDKFVQGVRKDDSDETVRINAEKCFTDAISADIYAGITKDEQFRGALILLKREALRMCAVVKKQLENSEFFNYGTEISYAEGASLPPVEVDFGTGKFNLTGKIDRVDMCERQFFVVDYKSGTTAAHFDETDLYTGQKMQLLVYLKAVKNSDETLVPVGYYYFALHDDFADVGKKDAPKVYTYAGRTLDDVDTACKIDKLLGETGESEKLSLKLRKGADAFNMNSAGKRLLTQQQIYNQVEYAMQMIKQAGQLMQKGYIAVSPYKGSCSYCDYKCACDFNDVLVYDEREVTKKIQAEQIDKAVEK